MQSVDVVHLPFEELTPLESPGANAQVAEPSIYSVWSSAVTFNDAWQGSPPAAETTNEVGLNQGQFFIQGSAMQAALADMSSADWAIACRGLLAIRRLSKHHTEQCRGLL